MKRALLAVAATALTAVVAVSLAAAAAPTNGRLIVSNPATNVGQNPAIALSNILAPNTYRTTIYVPAGYRAPGGVGAVGNNVGKAQVYVKQADGSRITLNGQLSVVNASQYPSTGCTGQTTAHREVWVLKANQTKGTATVTFPVFVDDQDTNKNMPASAAYTLTFCTGGLGMNITQVDLDLVRMFVNPQARGMYIWRAVYDPAAADGKSAAGNAGVTVASAVPINAQVTMKPHLVKLHARWVTLTGFVTVVNKPLAGVKVQVYVGHQKRIALNRPKATVRTKADGSYRVTLKLGKGHWYARAKASTPYQDITPGGGCSTVQTDAISAKGCVDATLAPFILMSNPVSRLL
ncbi:MAG TPA: hypothetical protein VI408_08045 [Gaiellaceae bacterium]